MTTTYGRNAAEAPAPPAPRPGTPRSAGADKGPSVRGLLLRLVLAIAAIVALFAAFGALDVLVVIAAIFVIVMVHELGHFATAKWSHMKVTQYFVGFGPPLWSIRRGETEYGVKPILVGGYVKIPGMTNLEEIDPVDEPRTYRQQPFRKRILVASAGSVMHLLMAFILIWVAIVAFGVPHSSVVEVGAFAQPPGHGANPAQHAGLKVGDLITSVNGHAVTDPTQLTKYIQGSPGKAITLGIQRANQHRTITVVPEIGHGVSDGTAFGPGKGKALGIIGISSVAHQTLSAEGPVRALGTTTLDLGRFTSSTVTGLGTVFSAHGISSLINQLTNPQAANQAAQHPDTSPRVGSIVAAARVATQAEHAGVRDLLLVLALLNIVLGLINLLPMLPFDGGHVAIAIYERIRTRRGQRYYQADVAKLLPVVYGFAGVLIVIVTAAVFLDIAHPVANQFH
jgi:membrane-associated protease RseP (regulator of RpoE activity)